MSSDAGYLQAVAKYSDAIRTGAVKFDYRTGACGPSQPTQPMSWGAACPPGFCTPDNLPASLGRWFSGDRAGCTEKPYTIKLTATSDVALVVTATVTTTSKVTMCPTRLLIVTDAAYNQWEIQTLQFGNQNQIVGGPAPVGSFGSPTAFQQTVPFVPDCLRAGMPYTITMNLKPEAMATLRTVYLTFIGPMVG
jgi:hypothetical protein